VGKELRGGERGQVVASRGEEKGENKICISGGADAEIHLCVFAGEKKKFLSCANFVRMCLSILWLCCLLSILYEALNIGLQYCIAISCPSVPLPIITMYDFPPNFKVCTYLVVGLIIAYFCSPSSCDSDYHLSIAGGSVRLF
jgi:hypothetical protein